MGEFSLPRDTQFDGTLVGGLSSLDYDSVTSSCYAASDDRGNDRPGSGAPRFYTLDVGISAGGIDNVKVKGKPTFLQADGTAFANGTVDPEGLRRSACGTFFWSSEGIRQRVAGVDTRRDPFIREAAGDRSFIREFGVPSYYGTAPDDSGVRTNFGFESLALSPRRQPGVDAE
ncbi:esterase-like activity of phytase family protein [Pacificimonas sp. WHA3]|uniref:Esterase-like activity of phytase family protein n=1 Tax=Pacificimonas pallii TaxID=2827236 RepID=A0ABS6SGN3_9SPHN|nr:esterase-like activity of phytase family protein [Pacificimonas pallii]MBV7257066.1 esterase-like activity of phytase family protein [Pacificimonas pallii]